MGSSNLSSASAPPPPECVGDDGTTSIAWPPTTTTLSSVVSSRLALFVDPATSSAHDSCLLGLGVTSALCALLWLARRYGPYVFVEAKSPRHRDPNDPTDRLLTRVHGRWHDLTTFDHPGGPIALSLIHRRDGTALFESHHPLSDRNKLLKILARYEVPGGDDGDAAAASSRGCRLMDPGDDGLAYDWDGVYDDGGFASDLRRLAREHFGAIAERRGVGVHRAAKATPARWAAVLSLMAAFFASLPRYVRGEWPSLLATPLLAWVTAVNYWHDGLHFSLSSDWRVNAWLPYLFPYYSSPWTWYHEHVIGHHAYPNIERRDPDLAHAPQLMREHSSVRWRPTHEGQSRWRRVLLVWSVALGPGLSLLNDARANAKASYNNVVPYAALPRPRLAAHVLGRAGYVLLLHAWPYLAFPPWKATVWATLPGAILSVCFMANTQVNHLTGGCAHARDRDFYRHQASTAQNFGIGSAFCYYFSGGLNYQIEHHLFPTVNHCHLPALSAGVRAVCERHGVPYHLAAGYRDAIGRHVAHTLEMERRPS